MTSKTVIGSSKSGSTPRLALRRGSPKPRGEGGAYQLSEDDARLTALVPVKHFNAHFLGEAFESLFAQSSPAWRAIIIVEPGELERLRFVLSAALADSRITLITNTGRKLSGAINTGLRRAQTEFVALLLGDDRWAHDAVGILNGYIERHPDVDFFYTSRAVMDDGGRVLGVMRSRNLEGLDDFVWRPPVKHLLCFRREKALALGGLDESLNSVGPDDFDFPWMMAESGARFHAVPECLYYYRDHRAGYRLTTHLPLSVHTREIARILRKHGVGWWTVARVLARSRRNYLKQCLYRNRLDQWVKERTGADPRNGWRQPYS